MHPITSLVKAFLNLFRFSLLKTKMYYFYIYKCAVHFLRDLTWAIVFKRFVSGKKRTFERWLQALFELSRVVNFNTLHVHTVQSLQRLRGGRVYDGSRF